MSDIRKFELREWLLGPLLVSFSVGLIIVGAIMVRW